MTDSFGGEACNNGAKPLIGLILANKFNDFLILSNPCSGLRCPGRSSHFGPPIAPSKTASACKQDSTVSSVSVTSCLSYATPPISYCSYQNRCPYISAIFSSTVIASSLFSGLTPSPGNTAILFSIDVPPFL